MNTTQCKICRKLGAKLFLKGDRCNTPKCAIVRKPYSPGEKPKKSVRRSGSEFSKELAEKQKLKSWYNLRERQFSGYVKKALSKRSKEEDSGVLLIKELETRLDNVVFRMGFSESRRQSKQLVGHGHFHVNGRKVDIPSYQVKKGDKITINPSKKSKTFFKNTEPLVKKRQSPGWIKFNKDKMEAEIAGMPTVEETAPPAELSAIFEFYSK
ncbi:MAG: 30S ribosomal protein S4 [Candidatus Nealsonbacteria bacterium RIFOXYB1_FULL_40_15]|uniref:Small ribosomal subunit protein uS4 n=2 Tax=Candidatus Nealsoniibacteriota TaxID=1817911 RepID=A0A1G2EPR5_9BACT|nr:MAG: 30S ribosomal protein S4 [Candidatus Nealsonbacteria bacterium RIFOXYB1_FULL_40_15]OGZ28635.1 MAG: 30S ribosomal protein S4 [Candidatus Nealsonbacteria bacterium RIFOXYD1_FULL_39_11]